MIAVLNPGHGSNGDGSFDPGAYNAALGVSEREVNVKVAETVKNILGTESINNFLTPIIISQKSWGLLPAQINAVTPDLIVSFHCNSAANPTATGTEVLYWHTSTAGRRFAQLMYENINRVLKLTPRFAPLKSIMASDRGAQLLYNTAAPCIIVEPFFLSNANDYKVFNENFQAFCAAAAKAIISYAKEIQMPV